MTTSSGGSKSKVKVLANLISGEGYLPGLQTATISLCPHLAFLAECPWREKENCPSSSYKATSPTRSGPYPNGLI